MTQETKLKENYKRIIKGQGVGAVLVRGASQSLIIQVMGTGLAFILQVVLARILGVNNYGDYMYVLTWVNILVLVGKMGYDTATLKYMPKYEVDQNWGLLKGFLLKSQKGVLIFSSVVTFSILLFAWFNVPKFSSSLRVVFYIGSFLVPALALLQLYGARLRGLKKILVAQVPLQVIRPLFIMVITGITYILLQRHLTSWFVMTINLVSVLFALWLSIWAFSRNLSPIISNAKPIFKVREWMSTAIPLLVISGMQLVMGQMDIIMLGILIGTDVAGIYSSAQRISTLVIFGLQAVNTMAAPMISELYSSGRIKELQRMVTLASWGIFAVTSIGSLVLIFLGSWILSIFGQAFIIGYLPLIILLIGNIVNALCGSVGFILNMTGNQKISGGIIAGGLVINFLLNLWLIPKWSMTGASIATATTMIYWNIFMVIVVIRKLKINPTIFRFK
ncbi:hypothetical protein DP73_04645 [Desulfosporosinus sp. HMP52]|uniref:flippase n=1 Tax=Desulfosporosinus sp. HMP52 TaxID=1487923 RepID=UPI00051F9623|nr:flippase [Desulfosporosinus sp. HMP52]KGK91257.1 hypothetical protein DP73_04645 [Desulfosporosinus sp. HMP52]